MRREIRPAIRIPARRGVALVYVALIALALVAVLGLAIDTGYVFLTAHQLQNAADAAALAGADEVPFDTAQAATDAVTEASKNTAAHSPVTLTAATDVIVGNYNRTTSTFAPNTAPYNACQVIARRTKGSPNGPLNLLFAPIFGITTSEVSRQAIAMNRPLGAGVILLDPTASPALQMTGTGSKPDKINITSNGAVVVDSNSSTAVQWTGNPYISAGELDIVGNDAAAVSGGILPTGTLNINANTVPDPLASLAPPSKPANTVTAQVGGKWPAGYYPNGLPAGVLEGGIYYIDNGIALNGNQSIDGSAGVLIYLHTGGITLKGNTTIDVNAMTSGPYAGIAYYEDRSNSSDILLRGTTKLTDTGTMYFPGAQVTIAGTPDSFGNQLIAGTAVIQGDAQLNINYDGRNPIYRHRAFIVN
jgi:Flp pilus assembly protein TadG